MSQMSDSGFQSLKKSPPTAKFIDIVECARHAEGGADGAEESRVVAARVVAARMVAARMLPTMELARVEQLRLSRARV